MQGGHCLCHQSSERGLTQFLPCSQDSWQQLDVLLVEMGPSCQELLLYPRSSSRGIFQCPALHIWAAQLYPMGYTTAGGWDGMGMELAGIPLLGMGMEVAGIPLPPPQEGQKGPAMVGINHSPAGEQISAQFLPSALPRLQ